MIVMAYALAAFAILQLACMHIRHIGMTCRDVVSGRVSCTLS